MSDVSIQPNSNQIKDVDLSYLLLALKDSIFRDLNCHAIGKVVSYDDTKKKAKIQIVYRKVFQAYNEQSNTSEVVTKEYAPLVDCPVIQLSGGQGGVKVPISSGDYAVVLFNDRNMDAFIAQGAEGVAPQTIRQHSLADGIALVGIKPFPQAGDDYGTGKTVLYFGDTTISLDSKVEIKNATKSLYTILDTLIQTLISAQTVPAVVGSPLPFSAAVISQLTTIKTDLGLLLK